MKLKRLLLLFIVTCISLVGCQGSNESKEPNATKGEKELELWHFDTGARIEIYNDAIKRFEEKHPGVKVNVVQV